MNERKMRQHTECGHEPKRSMRKPGFALKIALQKEKGEQREKHHWRVPARFRSVEHHYVGETEERARNQAMELSLGARDEKYQADARKPAAEREQPKLVPVGNVSHIVEVDSVEDVIVV